MVVSMIDRSQLHDVSLILRCLRNSAVYVLAVSQLQASQVFFGIFKLKATFDPRQRVDRHDTACFSLVMTHVGIQLVH